MEFLGELTISSVGWVSENGKIYMSGKKAIGSYIGNRVMIDFS